jgi:hypothetical protein
MTPASSPVTQPAPERSMRQGRRRRRAAVSCHSRARWLSWLARFGPGEFGPRGIACFLPRRPRSRAEVGRLATAPEAGHNWLGSQGGRAGATVRSG